MDPRHLVAGDRLRLTKELVSRTHDGKPIRVSRPGGIWTVIGPDGDPDDDIIWLYEPDGVTLHTWDYSDLFEWFEPV